MGCVLGYLTHFLNLNSMNSGWIDNFNTYKRYINYQEVTFSTETLIFLGVGRIKGN